MVNSTNQQLLPESMHLPSDLVAAFVLLLCVTCTRSTSSGMCELNNEELLQQKRMRTVRANILAQLNIPDPKTSQNTTEAPSEEESEEESEAVLSTYYALRNASESLEKERERVCQSEDYFAKPVTSFVGLMSPEDVDDQLTKREETGLGSASGGSSTVMNILSKYRIHFNFELPENLSDISRADLLLYQLPSATGSEYVIRDKRQYVEIKTIMESLDIQTVVEGKYIDVLDHEYQVFEITSAVKLWVAKELSGPVVLEVTVHCYSSLQCSQPVDGKKPVKVEFLFSSEEANKAPRIITVSKNPIEAAHKSRSRRQATGPGVGFCMAEQATCCLKPLTINFREDLGFTFILQPPSFEANYCDGVCLRTAGGDVMTPTLFDFLSRLGEGSPASSIEPCCAGNTYLPLEVLIKIDGNLVIEELQQVIVSSCRCT